jgi:branched-chain amino acid transport system permease protein
VTEFVQAIILGLLIGGVYALLASGLTLIFGVMNVINVAHGAFLIFAAFLTFSIWEGTGLDPLLTIAITTPAMFAFGWLLYSGTIRRIRRAPAAASVLLTFSLALVLEGVMGIAWGNTSHAIRPGYFNQSFTIGEYFLPKAQVYGCLVAIGVLVALYVFLSKTWTGRAIRASAVNPQGAALVGVAARSSACSIRSCPARTTCGSRACSASSCSAAWGASTGRSSARS